MASPVLGIDLGTTNSVVAHADETRVRVLRDENGRLLTPSTVSFQSEGRTAVGHAARDLRLVDAENTVFSIKRLIGRPFRSAEVKRAAARLPFRLEEGPTGGVVVRARNETYSLPEVSSYILRHLRGIAERALEQRCVNAVITVPANFNELQRMATRDAGRIAGLNVLRILNEPTAAALAYGYRAQQQQRIAVYDFGGGTFDISILELSGDVIEVIATAGDTHLGGDDIDRALADRMVAEFERQHGVDLKQSPQQYERVAMAAEWLKCQLSDRDAAEATIKQVAVSGSGASLDLRFRCGRADLDALSTPLINRTFSICEDALRLADVRPTQLDGVILVGGQTRTPRVRALVAEYFGTQPKYSVDPDLAVAQGAALQGYALSGVPAADPERKVVRTLAGAAGVPPPAASNSFEDEPARVALEEDAASGEQAVEASWEDMPATIAEREHFAHGMPSIRPESPVGTHSSTLSGVGDPHKLVETRGPGVLPNRGDTEPVSPFRTNAERPSAKANFGRPKAQPPSLRPPPARGPIEEDIATSLLGASAQRAEQFDEDGFESAFEEFPEAEEEPAAGAASPAGSMSAGGRAQSGSGAAGRAPTNAETAASPAGANAAPAPGRPPTGPHPAAGARPPAAARAAAPNPAERPSTGPNPAPSARPPAGRASNAPAAVEAAWPKAGSALERPLAGPPQAGGAGRSSAAPGSSASRPPTGPKPALPSAAPNARAATAPTPRLSETPPPGRASFTPKARAPGSPPPPPPRKSKRPGFDARAANDPGGRRPTPVPAQNQPDVSSQFPGPPSVAPLLLDVTPHTLCVETVDGFCEQIIERNAPIPTEQTRIFSTSRDNQATVSVRVCQGESRRIEDNQVLGQIDLLELRRARRGEVNIAVTFVLDVDGTLSVRAIDEGTGNGQELQVNLVGAIESHELDRMRGRQRAMTG